MFGPVAHPHFIQMPLEIPVPDKFIQDPLVDSGHRAGIKRAIPAVDIQQIPRQYHIADTDCRCNSLGKCTDVDHFSLFIGRLQGRNRLAPIPEFTVVIVLDQITIRLPFCPAKQFCSPADGHDRTGGILVGRHHIGHSDRQSRKSVRPHSLIIHVYRVNAIGKRFKDAVCPLVRGILHGNAHMSAQYFLQ